MNQEKKIKIIDNLIVGGLITLSSLILIFSFFAPAIFTGASTNSKYNFTATGAIGDTIGGLMNPFIALAGVFITFLAFYMQFKANKIQIDLINKDSLKEIHKKEKLREIIISDLKDTLLEELLETKNEIIYFNLNKHNLSLPGFNLRDSSHLHADIFNSIPIQELYDTFDNKAEFSDIVFIYKKIELIKKYALNNLFQSAIFDYSNKITLEVVTKKHEVMLQYIPLHIDEAVAKIQTLKS